MKDSVDDDLLRHHFEEDAIGKPPQQRPARRLVNELIDLGLASNSRDCRIESAQKSVAQTDALLLVPSIGVIKIVA